MARPGRFKTRPTPAVPAAAKEKERPPEQSTDLRPYFIGAFLIIITLSAFWGLHSCSFVRMDDYLYVVKNARVQQGITWENIKWAFSNRLYGFYFPVTIISHMLDCQIYGMNAGGHHVTSLMIHLLNVLVLFAVLIRISGAVWRSGAVAALFALHPLHVESVAWIAERKDVLCAFFWLSSILFYSFYVEKPSVKRYIPVFLTFLFGLMAKPMIITLPFTLLLLDLWPLRRWPPNESGTGRKVSLSHLIMEKLPLFFLVPVFALATFLAQKQMDAVAHIDEYPFVQRVANALISYADYLAKTCFPTGLAAYYPCPIKGVSLGLGALCGIALAAVTIMVARSGRQKRYLVTGWLWFLGTLVPVIGLVQVGGQSMADRYTYVPLVGIFIMIVWGASELASRSEQIRKAAIAALGAVLIVLWSLTAVQVRYWTDSTTLFTRMLAVTKDNWFAHTNLGDELVQQGKMAEAIEHYREAVRIIPLNAEPYLGLGNALSASGRNAEAIENYRQYLKINPENAKVLNDLGVVMAKEKRLAEATDMFRRALRLDPGFGEASGNLATALSQTQQPLDAIERYQKKVDADPNSPDALNDLGIALAAAGKNGEAMEKYRSSLKISPRNAKTFNYLGLALAKENRMEEAIRNFREAVRSDPGFYDARSNLGTALKSTGQFDAAIEQYEEALRIEPRSAQTMNNLGLALAQSGRLADAAERFSEAVQLAPESADGYINLGTAMVQQKRFAEAVDVFRQALAIRPDSETARANLEVAERLLREQGR